jgi:predicted RNase H-like HicB family nuclease
MREFKVLVEKHPDGYVAYPLGLQGVVIGEGDMYEEAVADVTSAIRFHVETFGLSLQFLGNVAAVLRSLLSDRVHASVALHEAVHHELAAQGRHILVRATK